MGISLRSHGEFSWRINGNLTEIPFDIMRFISWDTMGLGNLWKSHLLGACRLLVAKLGLLAGQDPPWEHNLTHDWHFIHAITEINEYKDIYYYIVFYYTFYIIYIYIYYIICYILYIIILYIIHYILYSLNYI